MKTLRSTLLTLLAVGSVVGANSASALPSGWYDTLPAWTSTASACSVDESSVGKYEFIGSQFRFLGNNISNQTGVVAVPLTRATSDAILGPVFQPITVRCNVTPMYDYVPAQKGDLFEIPASWKSVSWNSLVVGYKDPDGISTNASVTASLRKLSRATMTESTIASFNSNSSASVVAVEDVKKFTHTFDFLNNDYYIEINLVRKNTNVVTPVAYSVRLTTGDVAPIIK
ncbi:hypothetical protein [Methylocucumis oryzae]|uniref:Uncharacterized protein n=1 Tax=Methylocucumis oryzae TaxID=1632867 RepID=A0A0F3IIH2_9GAMM|nr:hypothetical protein [Methylocucumis oryzae]KJV06472.1 hypothetical protein VZ94_10885 [Methylocucumis oryzae]